MWEWLAANHGPVSAVTGILTLLVWLFYFQLLLSGYRRRVRAKILITRGGGRSVESRCIVTNMSLEPIYLEAIVIEADGASKRSICSLSDLDPRQVDGPDPRSRFMQGPLASGEMLDIGSYRDLLERASSATETGRSGQETALPDHFTLTVMATYTSDDDLVAAQREFTVEDGRLQSPTLASTQVRSRWQRSRLKRRLEREFDGKREPAELASL